MTLGGQLTKRAQWPVYASLYGDAGALIGRVNFRDIPQTSDLDGRLHWLRPAQNGAARFASGFEGDTTLTGSAYTRPAPGSRILALPGGPANAQLTFTEGPLADAVTRALKINTAHQITPTFGGYFTMTLDVGVGTFTGQIKLGGVGKVSFDGVLLPKTGEGRGQVRFAGDTGEVEFGPVR